MPYYKQQRRIKQLPKLSTMNSRRTTLTSYMTVRLIVATSLFQKKLMTKHHHPTSFIPQSLNCRLVYLSLSNKPRNYQNRCKILNPIGSNDSSKIPSWLPRVFHIKNSHHWFKMAKFWPKEKNVEEAENSKILQQLKKKMTKYHLQNTYLKNTVAKEIT